MLIRQPLRIRFYGQISFGAGCCRKKLYGSERMCVNERGIVESAWMDDDHEFVVVLGDEESTSGASLCM